MLIPFRKIVPLILLAMASNLLAEQTANRFEIRRSLDYLLFLPQNDDSVESLPMIVFLHGAGERGSNIEVGKKHGPPKIVETKKDFGFIVLSPQCPTGQRWNAPDVMALVQHIKKTHKVDKERIYLTGLSMGGYGTWSLGLTQCDRFAAIAPICGGGDFIKAYNAGDANGKALKTLGVWAFHGAKDPVVPLAESKRMVATLKKFGHPGPKLTVYPEAKHDSWTKTYANPELYKWFLQHQRK